MRPVRGGPGRPERMGSPMRGYLSTTRAGMWVAVVVAAELTTLAGCHSAGPRRLASVEPGLSDPGTTVVEGSPPAGTAVTFADRHPLFAKPREYYENSGNNKVVKAAAATIIGIPAGILGEMRQIVVGAPAGTRY